eukprot:scpid85504/ scgid31653/ 
MVKLGRMKLTSVINHGQINGDKRDRCLSVYFVTKIWLRLTCTLRKIQQVLSMLAMLILCKFIRLRTDLWLRGMMAPAKWPGKTDASQLNEKIERLRAEMVELHTSS